MLGGCFRLRGGFPEALRGNFRDWWEAYLRAYLERDLPWLGVKADPGAKVAFNVAVFRAEDQELRVLEGTLGESWKVDQAATLQFQ